MIEDRTQLRANQIIVHNTSGIDIPALSFAKITSYDKTNQHFNISKPDSDGLSAEKIITIPEIIVSNKIGIAIIEGIRIIKKTSGETIAAGDFVDTDANEWTAIKSENGVFYVITVSGDYLVIRAADFKKHQIRKAYCKDNAGAATTITCYLDTDGTGKEITVNCSIAGGGNLNTAIPRLADGTLIFVKKEGTDWYCVSPFQAIDETKGLEITSDKLAVNIDTDELQFSSGAIKTKLDECA